MTRPFIFGFILGGVATYGFLFWIALHYGGTVPE